MTGGGHGTHPPLLTFILKGDDSHGKSNILWAQCLRLWFHSEEDDPPEWKGDYTYWEGRCTVGYHPGTGRQIQRSVTGKTQREVMQKLRQITQELDLGTYHEPSRLTLGQWLDRWAADYLGGVKPSTAHLYRENIRLYLKPALGAVKLEALSTPPFSISTTS